MHVDWLAERAVAPVEGAQLARGAAPRSAASVDAACTCFTVRSLSRRLSQVYDEVLAPSGLKGTQFSLLMHARRREGQALATVSTLAQALHTDRTTLTRNLRTLQSAGWIALVPGPDARTRCVQVTASGMAAVEQAKALWRVAQAQVRMQCGDSTVQSLQRMAWQMLDALQAAPAVPAPAHDQPAAAARAMEAAV